MAEFTDRLRPLLLGALLCGGSALAATPLGVIEGTTGTVSFHGGLLTLPLQPDAGQPGSVRRSGRRQRTRLPQRRRSQRAGAFSPLVPQLPAGRARVGG